VIAGHLASAIAIKGRAPEAPILPLLVGAMFLDVLYPVFAVAGVDRATATGWSHSLLLSIAWSLICALLFLFRGRTWTCNCGGGLLALPAGRDHAVSLAAMARVVPSSRARVRRRHCQRLVVPRTGDCRDRRFVLLAPVQKTSFVPTYGMGPWRVSPWAPRSELSLVLSSGSPPDAGLRRRGAERIAATTMRGRSPATDTPGCARMDGRAGQ
jgi:hypothetical protein